MPRELPQGKEIASTFQGDERMNIMDFEIKDISYAGFGKLRFTLTIKSQQWNFTVTNEALKYISGETNFSANRDLISHFHVWEGLFLSVALLNIPSIFTTDSIIITPAMLKNCGVKDEPRKSI